MNIDAEIGFFFDISLKIGHLEVIVDPVDDKVGEPGVLALTLKQPAEQLERVLSKVISKYLKAHECLVVCQTLRELHQSIIIYIVVCHVEVN